MPPSPRLLGWRKENSCDYCTGVSLSSTSVFPPFICLCIGVVGLAELRDEMHQQRLVKESTKSPPLLCLCMSSSSHPSAEKYEYCLSMAEALLLFSKPALTVRGKIKFKWKRRIFGVVPYFKCSIPLPVLNNVIVHKARTFPLPRRALRHFNLQLVLGIWFCCCTRKNEWNELCAYKRSHGTSARDICYAFPVLSDPGWHIHSPTL